MGGGAEEESRPRLCDAISLSGNVMSYYVTNLPEGCNPWSLEKECRSFGEVVDVFISGKRNMDGCCFGFVKFKGVRDKVALEKMLDAIRIGGKKLVINLERYDRNGKPILRERDGKPVAVEDSQVLAAKVQASTAGVRLVGPELHLLMFCRAIGWWALKRLLSLLVINVSHPWSNGTQRRYLAGP
ncbi:hypothetical protein SSX86_002179 [Deinandra increscens subsp. villosa]|uniref:RRM domain-containing protein n=1 Tax=Deinandra increscens subsp. villosa TaxID=3103831 RepID=A0AAP0DSX9_9ASTR